ncbi:hypothetical protein CGMCC3_g14356 [Colletotrichum fructicola]|nr:uncharacterized protein CGMCC3_g14356 [Colletotrichum fructicola]KAE9569543.1 hypothetical protein CGMCC3_g14356 [Colletotrichum fructicola]KAF4423852.1 hypothetical protein CFRS1_v006896 [Colletotrichum fructicola]KAF4486227.1 hypothetical protein CGGC5_v005690 [Colletotrichum fructicola Nara gc5]
MATPHQDSTPAEPGTIVEFLAGLPIELSGAIFAHLPNSDLKKLRLASRRFSKVVTPHLSFKRVFISASNHNIQVFRNIANHETFRHDVREIVWDDARFMVSLEEESGYHSGYGYDAADSDSEDTPVPEGVPLWFVTACRENIDYLRKWRGRDVETLPQHVETAQQLAAQFPLDVAYEYYRKLVYDQEEVLATAADSAAFKWALAEKRFPNLRRVIITPAAHGILFFPQYPTPMIRAFPYGFNYPLPRSWPTPPLGARIPCESWVDEAIKDKWRGFRIVTYLLAQQEYATVPEVVIDGNQINSGLTCEIFSTQEPCEEYKNLAALVRKPGFSMLKLSIMVGMHAEQNYASFRNGRLRQLLTADLESFALETDEVTNLSFSRPWPPENPVDHFTPLRSIFPVEAWTHLRHFGLSRFLVKENDLLDLLGALPDTLRSVELSFLWFVRNSGGYRSVLFRIRDDLGWRSRSVRPRVIIRDDKKLTLPGRGIHMDKEVMRFLYDSGENPYPDDPRMRTVLEGVGTVRDVFEPRFERPFATREELIRVGIQKGWGAD